MATAKQRRHLKKSLERFEGRVPHLYLDSNGYVTVGVGHLLKTFFDAQYLKFQHQNGTLATHDEIRADYDRVSQQVPSQIASYYKKYSSLTLPDDEIDRLTEEHIETFERQLKNIYRDFKNFPQEAQLALFDIVFNVGATNLRLKWPKMNQAINDFDWLEAAKHSKRRPPISSRRNKYVNDLFEKAAEVAKDNSMDQAL